MGVARQRRERRMAVFDDAYTMWAESRSAQARAAPVNEVVRMVDGYRTRYCGWNARHYYTRYRRGCQYRSNTPQKR